MLSLSRVTVGVVLLLALVTACQSAPTPSFDLTLDPMSLALTQGEAKEVTVKLERLNGFTDPVAITLEGLPADVTANPATLTMAGTNSRATVRLTASGAAAIASSTVTIEGISGNLQKSVSLALTTLKPLPSFNLTFDPASVSLTQGTATDLTVKLERSNGFAESVALTLDGLPAGVTANPAAITIPANASSATVKLTASGTATIASSSVTIKGISGAISKSATLQLVTVKPLPNFNLTFDPLNLTLTQGESKEVTVKLERLNGFADPVAVTLAGLPTDVTVSPATLTIPATASSATLRLSASRTAAISSSTVTAEGISGTLKKSASLQLVTVKPAANFNLTFDPASTSLTQGAATDLTVKLERLNGFAEAVTVTVNGLPAGVTASPAALTIAATTSSATVRLTASGTAAIASTQVTAEGVSGALKKSASLQLVTVKPPANFNLTFDPASLTLTQGEASNVTVKLERLNGFTEAVALTLDGLPAGVTASPAALTIPANASSATIKLTASSTAAIASSSVTIKGISGALNKSAMLQLVTAKPLPNFNLTLDPTSASLTQGTATDLTVKLERLNGFADPVALTLEGLPVGVTATPTAPTISANASSATVKLTASSTAAIASSSVTIKGSSGTLSKSAALSLTTLKPLPNFNLSFDPTSLTMSQGEAINVTVKLERLHGFTDAVALTLGGVPADITASPTAITIAANASSATVRLTASGTAAIASSSVTIDGVSGTLQKRASLSLATIKPDPTRPDVFVKRLEWGQSILKSDLRLVAGKAAVLRVFVNATQAGISGVIVRATATVNGATVGTLDLTAPSNIPITDTDTSLASTYWGVLPKEWVKSGLEVNLEVDAGRNFKESNEANNIQILKPTVGAANKLYLMMVPIVQGGKSAQTLDAAAQAELKAALMRYWPLADVDIQVRAPYIIKSDGLPELIALRQADGSKRYYYGFEESCCGVGYVGFPVAAGNADPRTITHELGHNFGRNHAPGGTSDADVNYPNTSGKLDLWGFDPRDNSLVDPTKNYDLMSYFGPNWVSEYMYSRVQDFLEKNPPGDKVSAANSNVLLVSGTVANGQIILAPLQRITGVAASAPTSGQYTLSLETATGNQRVSFDLQTAIYEDAAGNETEKSHFSFTMPDPGSISKLTVSGYGVTSLQRSAAPTLARVQSVKPTTVQRSGSSVTVTWDAATYSSVAVAHIAPDGTRTTLALGLTGGTATLELSALGAGQFEVSASDGLNGSKQRF